MLCVEKLEYSLAGSQHLNITIRSGLKREGTMKETDQYNWTIIVT